LYILQAALTKEDSLALYRSNSKGLAIIGTKEFKYEKDLQSLLEANLPAVFGLRTVRSEFELKSLRIDTLGYDEEARAFVIIEYKRDKSSSVIDQGYAYLALVLNNKADFVLEYNEQTGNSANKSYFDWSATRVAFVASRFTPHQLGAINFQDLPIELWEVRRYEGDLLSVEQKLADNNAASIKTVARKTVGKSDDSVSKEIRTYSVDDVFPASKEVQRSIFDELSSGIRGLDDAIVESPKKYYVGYRIGSNWRMLLSLNPLKNAVRLDLTRTQPNNLTDPESRLKYNEKSLQQLGQHVSYMLVTSSEDVDYALALVRQARKRFLEEFGG
jgi:predicted transport protein